MRLGNMLIVVYILSCMVGYSIIGAIVASLYRREELQEAFGDNWMTYYERDSARELLGMTALVWPLVLLWWLFSTIVCLIFRLLSKKKR